MSSRHTCALSAREAQSGHFEGSAGLPRPVGDALEGEIWVAQHTLRNPRYHQTLRTAPVAGFFNTLLARISHHG